MQPVFREVLFDAAQSTEDIIVDVFEWREGLFPSLVKRPSPWTLPLLAQSWSVSLTGHSSGSLYETAYHCRLPHSPNVHQRERSSHTCQHIRAPPSSEEQWFPYTPSLVSQPLTSTKTPLLSLEFRSELAVSRFVSRLNKQATHAPVSVDERLHSLDQGTYQAVIFVTRGNIYTRDFRRSKIFVVVKTMVRCVRAQEGHKDRNHNNTSNTFKKIAA